MFFRSSTVDQGLFVARGGILRVRASGDPFNMILNA